MVRSRRFEGAGENIRRGAGRPARLVRAAGDEVERRAGGDPRLTVTLSVECMKDAVANIDLEQYDLIFVDDSTYVEERAETIRVLSARSGPSNVVVIHDYENKQYQTAAGGFAQHFTFDAMNPYTGVVWNEAQVGRNALAGLRKRIAKYSKAVPPDHCERWAQILSRRN